MRVEKISSEREGETSVRSNQDRYGFTEFVLLLGVSVSPKFPQTPGDGYPPTQSTVGYGVSSQGSRGETGSPGGSILWEDILNHPPCVAETSEKSNNIIL